MASKYDRIAATMRAQIRGGVLKPGDKLPPETELVAKHHVSLSTLRRALEVLEAEGLIEKRHGTGNFVRTMRQRINRTNDRYQWEKNQVWAPEEERRSEGPAERDTGLPNDDFMFEADYEDIAADSGLAKVFNLPEGTRLLRRVYKTRKRTESAPLGIGTSYIPCDYISANPDLLDVDNEPWPGGTQHQLSTVGIELDHIIDEVIARPATTDEVEELDLTPGTTVVCLRKISVDTQGRVVEVNDVIWPGDRIMLTYRTKLEPWKR